MKKALILVAVVCVLIVFLGVFICIQFVGNDNKIESRNENLYSEKITIEDIYSYTGIMLPEQSRIYYYEELSDVKERENYLLEGQIGVAISVPIEFSRQIHDALIDKSTSIDELLRGKGVIFQSAAEIVPLKYEDVDHNYTLINLIKNEKLTENIAVSSHSIINEIYTFESEDELIIYLFATEVTNRSYY